MNTRNVTPEAPDDTGAETAPGIGKGLANQAYEALMDLIFSRELQPGDQIQERTLALRLGISRTPLREAMHRMEGERTLERRNNRLVVRSVTLQEIMEALHVRRLLESEAAARSAGRVPPSLLADMRARIHSLLELDDAASPEHQKLDADLHGAVVDWCDNQMLGELIREVRRRTRMFSLKRMDHRMVPVCEEHLAIIDALERGDAETAAAETARHIDNIRQSIIDKLTR